MKKTFYVFWICLVIIFNFFVNTSFSQDIDELCKYFSNSTSVNQEKILLQTDSNGFEIGVWLKSNVKPKTCINRNNQLDVLQIQSYYIIVKDCYNISFNNERWSLLAEKHNFMDKEISPNNIVGWVSHKDLLFNQFSLMNLSVQTENGLEIGAWIKSNVDPKAWIKRKKQLKKLQIRSYYVVVNNCYSIKFNNKRWSLLAERHNILDDEISPKNIVGWVSHDDLLFDKFPLKNQDNEIYYKVLIKKGDKDNGELLSIYEDPKLDFTKDFIEVRTVFYVYDYYPRSSPLPSHKETKSLLISPQRVLDKSKKREPLLIGWVDTRYLSFWNTRLAVEFVPGYEIPLTDKKTGGQFTIIRKRPLVFDSLRNPILDADKDSYTIGCFAELTKEQLKLRKKIKNVKTGLEVLFVIDATRSMGAAIKKTLQGVEKISKTIVDKSLNAGMVTPQFGVLFYRDKKTITPIGPDKQPIDLKKYPFCQEEIYLKKLQDMNSFNKILKKHIACDSDITPGESLYKGLVEGVKNADFTSGENKAKRFRVVIHIGDSGDHGKSDNITVSTVMETFKKNSIHRYVAIDVSNKKSSSFAKSVLPIMDLSDKYKLETLTENLDQLVMILLDDLFKKGKEISDQIKLISRGWVYQLVDKGKGGISGQAEPNRVGVISEEVKNIALENINAHGIEVKDLKIIRYFSEVMVPKKSKDINIRILVKKNDINRIIYFLTMLAESNSDIKIRDELWNNILKVLVGGQTCKQNGQELSLNACNKMLGGIPVQAGFMKYKRSDFLNLSPSKFKKVICEAKIVLKRFNYLYKNIFAYGIKRNSHNFCDYEIMTTKDINADGFFITEEAVFQMNTDGTIGSIVRKTKFGDLIDKYFFIDIDTDTEIAWIPIEHLESEMKLIKNSGEY